MKEQIEKIKNLYTKIRYYFAKSWYEYTTSNDFYGMEHSKIEFIWLEIKCLWQRFSGSFMCKWFGHKYEMDDHGGPESGVMSAHCTRCGFGHSKRLY